MAQMAGSNLTGASLEDADLSYSNLQGVRLDGCCLVNANLAGADLSGSSLKSCDLRGADMAGADLSGCNLTGARLRDVKFGGVKLADAWAEWVDMAMDGIEDRASLEEVFVGIGKPVAQLLVEGRVGGDVWAVIISHLCVFHLTHPNNRDVRLRGIHEGIGASALYLEAEYEMSLAAYLSEFADVIGTGSLELFEKLAEVMAERGERGDEESAVHIDYSPLARPLGSPLGSKDGLDQALTQLSTRVEALQQTPFWTSDKAVLVLTGNRQIWLEATSNSSLTLRPPHGSALGVDLVRGHFVTEELWRSKLSGVR
jgi:hypothetical protein